MYAFFSSLGIAWIKSTPKSRIVNLSSDAHAITKKQGGISFDNLMWKTGYSGFNAYGRSKLANVYFTR